MLALVNDGAPTPVFCIDDAFTLFAVNVPVAVKSSNVTSSVVLRLWS